MLRFVCVSETLIKVGETSGVCTSICIYIVVLSLCLMCGHVSEMNERRVHYYLVILTIKIETRTRLMNLMHRESRLCGLQVSVMEADRLSYPLCCFASIC